MLKDNLLGTFGISRPVHLARQVGMVGIARRDEASPRSGHVVAQESIVNRCARSEICCSEVVLFPKCSIIVLKVENVRYLYRNG